MSKQPPPGKALPQETRRLKELTTALDRLQNFTLKQLRAEHLRLLGFEARSKNLVYLRRRIAWRLQELVDGGLSDLEDWAQALAASVANLRFSWALLRASRRAWICTCPRAAPALSSPSRNMSTWVLVARFVSLAAFLADVAEKPYAAPFVFDDPISSLDHDFEWQVALRLVDLAKDRQVLVFTHRLSLYGAIEDAAKKYGDDWRKAHLEMRYIESFGGVSGHPADEAAWNANTKKANNILLTRLTEALKAAEMGGGDTYRLLAQGICSDFRKLLERTIEDDLLNEVVKRHRRSVTTDNRIGKLPQINSDDCDFIDGLMTKYSSYEHSHSQEAPVFLPDEPELRADLEGLKDWREKFHQRGCSHA